MRLRLAIRPSDRGRSADFGDVFPTVPLRQPIVDACRRVLGYEVLAAVGDPSVDPGASARLLLQAFTGPDLDLLTSSRPAYLTVAPGLFTALDLLPFAADRVVLQLDGRKPLAPEVREAIARQARLGYVFAATHVISPVQLLQMPAVSLVRLDVGDLTPAEARDRVAAFTRGGTAVHCRGVDTAALHDATGNAGCEGFQGRYWTMPSGAVHAQSDLGRMSVAVDLLDPAADLDRLVEVIGRDLALTYGILRYVNSAFFARRTEIATVRQACTTLGERMTRRWALVLTLSAATGGGDPALLGDALLRARVMETVAADLPGVDRDIAFTVGLLSLAPGLLGVPMETVVGGLALPADAAGALLEDAPPYGGLLTRVGSFLTGEDVDGPGAGRIADAYGSALEWVQDAMPALARRPAVAA